MPGRPETGVTKTKVLAIRAEIKTARSLVVQPYTARVVRQVLFKVAEETGADWLAEALRSNASNKPYAYTPLYTGTKPLYKDSNTDKPIVLYAGKSYTFNASIIINSIDDVKLLYGFAGQLELYDKKVSLAIKSAEILDEQAIRLPLRYGERILLRFETPTLLQLPKPRKPSKVNRYIPFPVPSLIFRSLKQHWNAYASEKVTSSSWRADYALVVENYRLEPRTAYYDARRRIRGFVGWAQYRVTTHGEKLLAALSSLLAYAQLMNVGKSRSAGFGVVKARLLGEGRSRRFDVK